MHFSLIRVSTPHMPDTRGFDDVLIPLQYAFRRLGYDVEIRLGDCNPNTRNIILGANYDPDGKWWTIPPGSIIFNLEQLEAGGYPWLRTPGYFNLLRRHEVWDFSRRNQEFLAGQGIDAGFLPLGYVPEMTRLAPCPAPASDVLFYGAMTPRRRRLLDDLAGRGLAVNRLTRAYGRARDQALHATRLFLNIHHSLPASLEIVRLGYALANARAVVSELAPDTYCYPELREACAYGEYDRLADLASDLAADQGRRERLARQGFEIFSAFRLDHALEKLVGRRLAGGRGADLTAPPARPDHLRVGAGPDFLSEALNVETDPRFRPDLRLDLSAPLDPAASHHTDRFGKITLAPASFGLISAPGLLARVADPDQLMTNFLALLRDGGLLILTLPYDLSEEAAEGRRAFNERSLIRYTRRAVLLGWAEARFDVEEIGYHLSDLGRVLTARGCRPDVLARTPRAVRALRVVLRKCPFRPEELTGDGSLTREWLLAPAADWQVAEPAGPAADAVAPDRLPSPPGFRLRLRLGRLILLGWRYRFNLRFKTGKSQGRYQDKLAEVTAAVRETRRLLKL